MSVIAVFIALGGTAAALKANSVGSRAIKNDTIKSSDLRDGKVKGKDLAEGAVSARELGEGALNEIPAVLMKDDARSCDPNSPAFVNCGSLFLNVGARTQALLVAGGEQYGDANADGTCRFRANGDVLLGGTAPSIGDPRGRAFFRANGFGMTAVSDPLSAGARVFRVECNQNSAADVKFSSTFSVLGTGPQ
jgi:hypothetical protein